MEIIDCVSIRDEMIAEAKSLAEQFKLRYGRQPKLVVVQVEGDFASDVYVRNKGKACSECEIEFEHIKLPQTTSRRELLGNLKALCIDPSTEGVMLQLPLPVHLKQYEQEFLDVIPYYKDVDGLSTESVGRLWNDLPCISPATPTGVLRLLPKDLSDKSAVIIGRSKLVGKPLVKLLEARNATVQLCHSKTNKELLEMAAWSSDYVIAATGQPKWLNNETFDYYNIDRTVIDVGICRDENNKLCGDIDLNSVLNDEHCTGRVTPTPKGTGILTVAQLMLNVMKAVELQVAQIRRSYLNLC